MGDFKINEKTVFTQSGSAEPAMGSTITGIPAAGITGTIPDAVDYRGINQDLGTTDSATFAKTLVDQIYWKGGPTTRDTTAGWHEIALNTTLASNIQSYFTIGSTSITISHAGFYHFYGHTKINANDYTFGNSVMVGTQQVDHRESSHFADQRVAFDWTGELSATTTLSVKVYMAAGTYACEACSASEATVVNLVYLGE